MTNFWSFSGVCCCFLYGILEIEIRFLFVGIIEQDHIFVAAVLIPSINIMQSKISITRTPCFVHIYISIDTDIDECATTPCLHNGICVDGVNRFDCRCAAGYTGTICETGM